MIATYDFPVVPDEDDLFSAALIYSGDVGDADASAISSGCFLASDIVTRFRKPLIYAPVASYSNPGVKFFTVKAVHCKVQKFVDGSPIFEPINSDADTLAEATFGFSVQNELGGLGALQFQLTATDLDLPPGQLPFQVIGVPESPHGTILAQAVQLLLGQHTEIEYNAVDPGTGTVSRVPARFTIQSQTPNAIWGRSQIFDTPTKLFPNNVLLPFRSNIPEFLPVHSGSAIILVEPVDPHPFPTAPVFQLQIVVPTCPYSQGLPTTDVQLGTKHNAFDDEIICFADLRGIPPQLIKAHIDQEAAIVKSTGEYNPSTFRYEPLSWDFAAVSFGANLRTDPRFAPYRLATKPDSVNSALAQGTGLVPADLSPRQKYFVQLDPNDPQHPPQGRVLTSADSFLQRQIAADDSFVSMENIFWTNDKLHVKENWSTIAGGKRRLAEFSKYQEDLSPAFVAQTVLASSYGLLQVMYPTAVDRLKYKDVNNVGLPPSGLLDEDTSIDLGTEFVSSHFRRHYRTLSDSPGTLDSFDGLLNRFATALQDYNADSRYPVSVLDHVVNFPPIAH